VPPLVHRIGQRAFSGHEILDEYAGTVGLLLWILYRDAELWSTAVNRTQLFHRDGPDHWHDAIRDLAAPVYAEIKPSLTILADLARAEAPNDVTVASACETIAGWSEQQNRLGTAVEYAQVASFAQPDRAMHAVRAARVLRIRAEYERAVTWFDHAIIVARKTCDWEAYAQAYSGLGCLFIQRGNYRRARVVLKRSLRTALRHSLPERVGAACHNLFSVEAVTENWVLAEQYADQALANYLPGSRGLPRLARDLAFRWLQRGYFERALPLSCEVLRHFSAPADRALIWSDIARAAAGCGQVETFEDAWAQAYALTKQDHTEPFTVDILLNLAYAAAFRRDVVRGSMTAQRAAELARQRKQGTVVLEAEGVLSSLNAAASPVLRPQQAGEAIPGIASRFVEVLERVRATV
jgi:tetratricopeptide (TPR) repeat protein